MVSHQSRNTITDVKLASNISKTVTNQDTVEAAVADVTKKMAENVTAE